MHVVQLEVKDEYLDNIIDLLNSLENVMIDNVEIIECVSISEDDLYSSERKASFNSEKSESADRFMKRYRENEEKKISNELFMELDNLD